MKANHLTLAEIVAVCAEHLELIKKEVSDREKEAKTSKGWLSFERVTDIRSYRNSKQYFAIEGSIATGLLVMTDDDGNLWLPAILDGIVFSSYPNEGNGGIAHLCFLKKHNHWGVIWIDAGWLHKEEFEKLAPVEISDRLVEEILEGKNIITTKPVGWL